MLPGLGPNHYMEVFRSNFQWKLESEPFDTLIDSLVYWINQKFCFLVISFELKTTASHTRYQKTWILA